MDLEAARPTPARIVEADGSVHTGWFERPFAVANLEDAPADHLLARLRGTPLDWLERAARRWRLKQWHYTSVATSRVLFACAVVDAGYAGNAFAYVVDRKSKRIHQYSLLTPAASGIAIAPSSIDGTSRVRWPGFGSIALRYDRETGIRRVEAHLEGKRGRGGKPPLYARFDIREDGAQPIAVVEPSGPSRWLYTHKCYALQAGGTVRAGDICDEVAAGEAYAGIDWNRGYRPTETYWNWAAASGRAKGGARIGFNLTAHRRPGQPTGGEDAGDCALWTGGRAVKLGPIEFRYDSSNLLAPWTISDRDGLVALRFHPDGERAEDINLGLVVSRFHQPYGCFSGEVGEPGGRRYAIEQIYGVCEQHFARW